MAVLYRKYRPQTFAEVLGQKHVIKTLLNQVAKGSVAHAYLFTGSRGVGKTSIARILAKAINCQKPSKSGDPDGECAVCKQIENGTFIDLIEIDAASNTGVDNIRDLIEHVKFSPSLGGYKVFIIDEVHMLSKGAFNALLKTLEEPPKHAVFVLATTEIHKVPATIISRTQRFDFHAPSVAELTEHLTKIAKEEKIKINKEVLQLVAQTSQGSVRDSLSLLDKVVTLGDNPSVEDVLRLLGVTDIALSEELFSHITAENVAAVPAFFDSLTEKGTDFSVFNKDFLEYSRKALLLKVTGVVQEGLSSEQSENLQTISKNASISDIIYIIRLFLKSYKDLASSPDPALPVLLASLEACIKKQPAASLPKITQPIVAPNIFQSRTPQKNENVPPVAEFAFTHVLEPTTAVSIPETEQVSIQADESVTLSDIKPFWPQILLELKEINSVLGNLLKNSPIQKVEQGKVYLGVKFLFHKQNLESQKNLKTICDVIQKITGKVVGLSAQIVKDTPQQTHVSEDTLGDALRIFGGELVE